MKKIIFPNELGGISVLTSTGVFSLEETAKKDVPTHVKYKIIEHTEIPESREFRNAWEYDFDKNGYDGVGE